MSHIKDKWVIVFLIYADFRKKDKDKPKDALTMTEQMKAELNSMFKDILTVPLDSNRARMYVIMNTIDYKEEGSCKTEAKTLFYEIGNPNYLKYNQITACKVISNEIGDIDRPNPGNPVQKPEILKKILKDHIQVQREEEVFFITWDHGSAFGIFREVDHGVVMAELRKPIHHNLERYPYLAEFWNKALEKDFELTELVDQNNHKKIPDVIQIGHNLFRLENISIEQGFLEKSNLITQTKLKVIHKDSVFNGNKFRLVYNESSEEFEVHIDNPLDSLTFSNNVIAELTDVDVREILSNDELATVFKEWIGADKKVAVLLMMNCWMMNLHTMYSLHETVKCLVAPQGNIGTPGYNYRDILNYLFNPRSIFKSPEELAIRCVSTSENKRMRRRSIKLRADKEDMIDKWKIFAVDLQREGDNGIILIDHLNKINQFVDKLIPKDISAHEVQELISLYKSVRLVCFDFTLQGSFGGKSFIVDIINWFNILTDIGLRNPEILPIDHTNLSNIKNLVNTVRPQNVRKHLVLKESIGKDIYNYNGTPAGLDRAVVGFHPTGYGLFFPNEINNNQNLINNVKNDSLLQEFLLNWKKFIQSVYDKEIWKVFFDYK
ncbi:hypothetical protein IC229_25575 [Spirosoma sp. BT702]|uniref:Uncharacterized protein n=1 Tax=Spirosoma profusum TaxID=2771354 RepID=A0A926Y169_9BACT|nr:hypothetical protein [Spirosoma profusum]MBD2704041.1 hypothetical protein [Spirosoma profusum]